MVDMPHDHNHGAARLQVLRRVLAVVDDAFLDGDNHLALDNRAHFGGDDSGGVIVDDIRDGGHDA